MRLDEHARGRPWLRAAVLGALLSVAGTAPAAEKWEGWENEPYFMIDGKVDFGTYNGFRRFHSACHVCHGPDALGSSLAPNLVESLARLSYTDFIVTVAAGRTTERGGTTFVMPAFGNNPDVAENLDDIYAYLKARANGALGRGRPQRLPKGTARP